MWLTLLVTVVTYLLSPRGTSEERRQALLNAGLAGGATYVATEYTDWGKELSADFDSAIGVRKTPIKPAGTVVNADGSSTLNGVTTPAVAGAVGAVNSKPAAGGSLWTTLSSWGPGAVALAGGAAAAVTGSPIILIGAALLVGYLVLK